MVTVMGKTVRRGAVPVMLPAPCTLDGSNAGLRYFAGDPRLRFSSQPRYQKSDLRLNLSGVRYSFCDFFLYKQSISFAQTVDSDFQPPFTDAHFDGKLAVGNFRLAE